MSEEKSGAIEVWEEVQRLKAAGLAGVVVTVAAVRGSVPTEAGAKILVNEAGLIAGTVGGGKVEAQAVSEAQRLMGKGEGCELVTWNLQRDVGMTCGGEMTLLFEAFGGEEGWHVVVFGAGHVSQAVVGLLATLSCRVDVVDEREEWLQGVTKRGNVVTHLVERFEEGVGLVREDSFALSITKGHSADRPVLKELLLREKALPFVGVIGSASKRAVLMRELREDGVAEERLGTLICPLGLPIGNNEPAEIAVSIVAQLLEVRG
ncbi:MAG: xanthine dehydrogenase accessory protein XdhC [Roseibacillus sp.]